MDPSDSVEKIGKKSALGVTRKQKLLTMLLNESNKKNHSVMSNEY